MFHCSHRWIIYCDNTATRRFARNDKCSSKSEYLEVKNVILDEKVRDHLVSIKGMSTDFMIVDPLTKALVPKVFKRYVVLDMGLIELP